MENKLTKAELIQKINIKFIKGNTLYIPRYGQMYLLKKEVSVISPDAHQRHYANKEPQTAYMLCKDYGILYVRLKCYIEDLEDNINLDNVIKLDRLSKPDVEKIYNNC